MSWHSVRQAPTSGNSRVPRCPVTVAELTAQRTGRRRYEPLFGFTWPTRRRRHPTATRSGHRVGRTDTRRGTVGGWSHGAPPTRAPIGPAFTRPGIPTVVLTWTSRPCVTPRWCADFCRAARLTTPPRHQRTSASELLERAALLLRERTTHSYLPTRTAWRCRNR